MLLPRLAALSEIAWSETKDTYGSFMARVHCGFVPVYQYFGLIYAPYAFARANFDEAVIRPYVLPDVLKRADGRKSAQRSSGNGTVDPSCSPYSGVRCTARCPERMSKWFRNVWRRVRMPSAEKRPSAGRTDVCPKRRRAEGDSADLPAEWCRRAGSLFSRIQFPGKPDNLVRSGGGSVAILRIPGGKPGFPAGMWSPSSMPDMPS